MALIKCPECGHDVSDTASKCPNCGYELQDTKDEVVLKRCVPVKIICDITCVLSIFLAGGTLITLLWTIGYYIYCKNADGRVVDLEWYEKQFRYSRQSFFIVLFFHLLFFAIVVILPRIV